MKLKKIIKLTLILICYSTPIITFEDLTKNVISSIDKIINNHKTNRKEETYTICILMAADNDLFPFAGRNIKQMQNIGSNARLKIVIHFDMHRPGQKKISKRLLIEKNKITQFGEDTRMDSGDMETIIDFAKWSIEKFPADNYVFVLWNHGTGILEPALKKSINPSGLFTYNSETKLIELNREIGFLDYINSINTPQKKMVRGICFDDTTGNYLTNKKLKQALNIISKQYLNGKKIALLACDACLMSMIEVAWPLKDEVEYFVGSQEVELGTGYNYTAVLSPFTTKSPTKLDLAQHIVNAYKETYSKITNDYTQSAFDLSKIDQLEKNINELSQLLINGLSKQKNKSVKEAIKLSRNKNFCTYFDEPSYIDLGHFYGNLQKNLVKCTLNSKEETNQFKEKLSNLLKLGLQHIKNLVISNTAGKNFQSATGISIYFPEYHIHSSYYHSDFAQETNWLSFLKEYLNN